MPVTQAVNYDEIYQDLVRRVDALVLKLQKDILTILQGRQPASNATFEPNDPWSRLPKWRGLRGVLRSMWYGQSQDNPDFSDYFGKSVRDWHIPTIQRYNESSKHYKCFLESVDDFTAQEIKKLVVERQGIDSFASQEIQGILNRFRSNLISTINQSSKLAFELGLRGRTPEYTRKAPSSQESPFQQGQVSSQDFEPKNQSRLVGPEAEKKTQEIKAKKAQAKLEKNLLPDPKDMPPPPEPSLMSMVQQITARKVHHDIPKPDIVNVVHDISGPLEEFIGNPNQTTYQKLFSVMQKSEQHAEEINKYLRSYLQTRQKEDDLSAAKKAGTLIGTKSNDSVDLKPDSTNDLSRPAGAGTLTDREKKNREQAAEIDPSRVSPNKAERASGAEKAAKQQDKNKTLLIDIKNDPEIEWESDDNNKIPKLTWDSANNFARNNRSDKGRFSNWHSSKMMKAARILGELELIPDFTGDPKEDMLKMGGLEQAIQHIFFTTNDATRKMSDYIKKNRDIILNPGDIVSPNIPPSELVYKDANDKIAKKIKAKNSSNWYQIVQREDKLDDWIEAAQKYYAKLSDEERAKFDSGDKDTMDAVFKGGLKNILSPNMKIRYWTKNYVDVISRRKSETGNKFSKIKNDKEKYEDFIEKSIDMWSNYRPPMLEEKTTEMSKEWIDFLLKVYEKYEGKKVDDENKKDNSKVDDENKKPNKEKEKLTSSPVDIPRPRSQKERDDARAKAKKEEEQRRIISNLINKTGLGQELELRRKAREGGLSKPKRESIEKQIDLGFTRARKILLESLSAKEKAEFLAYLLRKI